MMRQSLGTRPKLHPLQLRNQQLQSLDFVLLRFQRGVLFNNQCLVFKDDGVLLNNQRLQVIGERLN